MVFSFHAIGGGNWALKNILNVRVRATLFFILRTVRFVSEANAYHLSSNAGFRVPKHIQHLSAPRNRCCAVSMGFAKRDAGGASDSNYWLRGGSYADFWGGN